MGDICKNVQVYVIDDELLICDVLCEVLDKTGGCQIVGSSTNGMSVLNDIIEKKPDVVFMDLKLNDENGFDLISRIRLKLPETRIIVLSGYCNTTLIGQAIKSGASAYLTKNMKIEDIFGAINITLSDPGFYLAPESGINLNDIINEQKLYPNQYSVTRREREILLLIAKEFSTREIAEKLGISEKTVRNHKSHMMQKLNIKSDAGLIKYAYYMAYI